MSGIKYKNPVGNRINGRIVSPNAHKVMENRRRFISQTKESAQAFLEAVRSELDSCRLEKDSDGVFKIPEFSTIKNDRDAKSALLRSTYLTFLESFAENILKSPDYDQRFDIGRFLQNPVKNATDEDMLLFFKKMSSYSLGIVDCNTPSDCWGCWSYGDISGYMKNLFSED